MCMVAFYTILVVRNVVIFVPSKIGTRTLNLAFFHMLRLLHTVTKTSVEEPLSI